MQMKLVWLLTRSRDQVNIRDVKTLGISEFKTHCIRLLKDANRSREPFIVTRRGEPLVRIEPIPGAVPKRVRTKF